MMHHDNVTLDSVNQSAPQEVSATQPPETTASSSSATPMSVTSDTRPGRRYRRYSPMKIAIGMGIAAFAYVLMVFGSLGLPKLAEVQAQGGLSFAERVTPWLLVATYLILTIAELFISPLGLSFVSKVAPQKLQGLMQGCWLGATALGNGLLFIGPILYKRISISATWSIFVIVCAISMFAMLAMVKWLERVTK